MSYTVKLSVYSGPLDLLLELIEQAELDITKVALAKVTDQYLAYMKRVPQDELEDLAAFLAVAARLLLIKSQALLSRPSGEEPTEEDDGDALARQLIIYRTYKEAASQLSLRQETGLQTFSRLVPHPSVKPYLTVDGLGPDDLYLAMQTLLASLPHDPGLEDAVSPPRIRIRDHIARILTNLRQRRSTSFWHLMREARTRIEVVVAFLAVLELVKLQRIAAQQQELFGDIELLRGEAWEVDQDAEFELEFGE